MKRFHVNVAVRDLEQSVGFYTSLFGVAPSVRKADYAKWMLEDPRVNFAISARGPGAGVDHVGLQTDDEAELAEIRRRLATAELSVLDQPDVTCCYARSTKAWVKDPDGLAWETFLTRGEATEYGDGTVTPEVRLESAACCDAAAATAPAGRCCGV